MISPQEPIESPLTSASTASEVMAGVDLTGQLVVVTGGYSGIGLITAKNLAFAGAQVIVPARDLERARMAVEGIENISIHAMDLLNPESIQEFSQGLVSRGQPVSLLINCAGVMATPLKRDAEGHEGQFSINHLGHFRLTCGLWPMLIKASEARVVSMSSRGHRIAGIDFDDIDFLHRPYDKWVAYGQSKTANALFAIALDRRGIGHGVRAFSLHPGQILTDLARHLTAEEIAGFDALDEQGRPRIAPEVGMKTVEQGAATGLWCATSTALAGMGGVYCEDCNIASLNESGTGRNGVEKWAASADFAERLWAVSEHWTGMTVD